MSINKVAKLAGVSSSTVSRVINNHPRVAPETAQNVRKAMQELNYTPIRSPARAKAIVSLAHRCGQYRISGTRDIAQPCDASI